MFAIGAFAGPAASPYGHLYRRLVRPQAGSAGGAGGRTTSAVRPARRTRLLACWACRARPCPRPGDRGRLLRGLAAAFLNAAFGLCLGCEAYLLIRAFSDPDGLLLELVATPRVERVQPWSDGPVPAEHAVRGIHGATIWEDGGRGTAEFLTAYMGLRQVGEEESRLRFESAAEGAGTVVDLRRAPGFWSGAEGVGTVHHVAFRAPHGAAQLECRSRIEQAGLGITPVVDRQYFQSVYFREPGGVLFEIATDRARLHAGRGARRARHAPEAAAAVRAVARADRGDPPPATPASGSGAPLRSGGGGVMTAPVTGMRHRFVPASRPGLPAAAPAARHRRQRGRSAAAGRAPAPGRRPAEPAGTGPRARHAALLPPAGGGGVRP